MSEFALGAVFGVGLTLFVLALITKSKPTHTVVKEETAVTTDKPHSTRTMWGD